MGSADSDLLRRYLLGEASESEQEHLERAYFASNELWETVNAAADDLIDSYVRGDLSSSERAQFENHFLASPARRHQVEFARLLMHPDIRSGVAERPTVSTGASQQAEKSAGSALWQQARSRLFYVATALVLVIAAAFLLVQNLRLQSELRSAQSGQADLQRELGKLRQQVANTSTNPSGEDESWMLRAAKGPVIALSLTPGLPRSLDDGPHEQVLPLSSMPATVVLMLNVEHGENILYEARVRTAEGKEVRRLSGLKFQSSAGRSAFVIARLPSQLFRHGVYIVDLYGKVTGHKTQIIQSYSFNVVKQLSSR